MNFDWLEFKNKVKDYAYIIGINAIGFTDELPLKEHLPRLEERIKAGYQFAINEGEPKKRVDPRAHLKSAKSVISIVVRYSSGENSGDCGLERNKSNNRGRISFISRGVDYHQIVRDKLQKLSNYIKENSPIPAEMILMVDTGELLEKAFSVKAGLGWIGKHTLLINPDYGTWICLGEIITNLPFPKDVSALGSCGECNKCVEACPTGALDGKGNLNPDKCLASITQTKKTVPRELRPFMQNFIYGCDICQKNCPHNIKTLKENNPEVYDINDAYPSLQELLTMSGNQFKKRFGHTSGAWRGRTVWQRNALIAAGNLRAKDLTSCIANLLLNDPREQIRIAAAWALGQIRTEESLAALKIAKEKEQNDQVLEEINTFL